MRSYRQFNKALSKRYDEWMIAMHYAKVTQITYGKIIRRYVDFFGNTSIATANHDDIRKYIAHISQDGKTLGSVCQSLGVLRQFYDFLNLGGVVSYVAPRFVRLRRPPKNQLRTLTEAQVRQFIGATRTLRERALVEFFYATGCRLSEALHLKIEDIDFGGRSARIRGKLGKVRTVLLTRSAASALQAYIVKRRKGFVFQMDRIAPTGCLYQQDGRWKSQWRRHDGRSGKPFMWRKCMGSVERMSYDEAKEKHDALTASLNLAPRPRKCPMSKMGVQAIIKRIGERAGLKNVTPHAFRRTFATHMYEHGADVYVIKALMGHVWVQTTMRYARIGPDRMAKIFERCHPGGSQNDQTSQ
jgi:integrase/recombinase XerD